MHEVIYASATTLARAIRAKETSSAEVVHAYLQRIAAVNPALNVVDVISRSRKGFPGDTGNSQLLIQSSPTP